ncbi:MAG: hypothetical protein K6G09_07385 [Treponema sp.]|nr:hypothetical protein [Treponema sp.]
MKKYFCILLTFLFIACFSHLFAAPNGLSQKEIEAYTLTFFKKFNDTQTKLTYMNKKSPLAKVGTETVKGKISGTIFYDVQIKGAGALVTLRYTNYCDEDGWIFDGEILTRSNMAQNGIFSGTIKVTCPANSETYQISQAEISYDNVLLIKGMPGDGYYLVTIPDSRPWKVDYTFYLKSKE